MKLYEHDRKQTIEPPVDSNGFHADDVVVLYVDKRMLQGDQNVLKEFAKNKNGPMASVDGRGSMDTIRALAVLLHLVNNPNLCTKNSSKAEETENLITASLPEKPEEAVPTAPKPKLDKNESFYYRAKKYHGESKTELVPMPRFGLFLETIYARDRKTVKGWCFWIFAYDPAISLDDGIGYLVEENRKSKSRRPPEMWQWAKSTADWISEAVSSYTGGRYSKENEGDEFQTLDMREAYLIPLRDSRNPVQCKKVFTFTSSRDTWDDTFCIDQMDASMYFTEADTFKEFPFGARLIPPTMRKANDILSAALERPAYEKPDENEPQSQILLNMRAESTSMDEDRFLALGDTFRDARERGRKIDDPECFNQFSSWMSSEHCQPGPHAAWVFVRDLIDRASIVPSKGTSVIDPTLSDFGNAVAWELLCFEQILDAEYLHTELLFMYINVVGAYRMERGMLRVHTLTLGPPASGKSWMQDTLEKLCPPGTTQRVSYQTTRANTTGTSRDGIVQLMDESIAGLSDKGGDGSGQNEIKQMLSSGETHSEHCHIDENGHRKTIKTESKLLVQVNANGNARKSAYPEPILNRFYVKHAPARRRKDGTEPSLREFSTTKLEMKKESIREHQIRGAICGLVSYAVDLKWFPDVDMDYAVTLLSRIIEHLRDAGCSIDSRTVERIIIYCRSTTIWFAVYKVFKTNDHFPPGTKFELKHLLECVRYLRCSREIVYFCVSHMYDALIDVNAPVVIKAIMSIIRGTGLCVHPLVSKGSYEVDETTYLLRVPKTGDDYEIRMTAIKAITSAIKTNDCVTFSEEMVADTLDWFATHKAQGDTRPSMEYNRCTGLTETGIRFSRKLMDGDVMDHVTDAIKKTMDEFVWNKRFVTGITYRGGIAKEDGLRGSDGNPIIHEDRMFPHLFRVTEAKVDESRKHLTFRNEMYKDFGYYQLFAREGEECDENENLPYIYAGVDLDDTFRVERLANLSIVDDLYRIPLIDMTETRYATLVIQKETGDGYIRFPNEPDIRCNAVLKHNWIVTMETTEVFEGKPCLKEVEARYPDIYAEKHSEKFDVKRQKRMYPPTKGPVSTTREEDDEESNRMYPAEKKIRSSATRESSENKTYSAVTREQDEEELFGM